MKITEVLTADELKLVTAKSDWQAAWMVLSQYLMLIGIFLLVALWTNPLSFLLGTVLLAGRQLGFGILSHECGHQTLFKQKQLNDFAATWLVAPPRFSNNAAYMRGHLQHHRLAGTRNDPDLRNYEDYPITPSRLKRKLGRDITGRTGWREVKSIALKTLHWQKLDAEARGCLFRGWLFTLLLLGTLVAFGQGLLFFMWLIAFVFINPLLSRIRQVAEHAAVPDLYDLDPRHNTRTVIAGPLARMIFAPHRVNYHLEHHMLASVPAYRLKTLHALLKKKGYYDDVIFPNGYLALLRIVTAQPAVAV